MPDHETLKQHKHLQFLGDRLHDPNLWHLNRHSVARAFAIGLFFAWVPLPLQMAMSGFAAFYFRANLPIAVALVWVSNPITMPPLFFFAYQLGLWVLNLPSPAADFEFTFNGVLTGLSGIWEPFLLGCFIIGLTCSVLGYFGVQALWRYHVLDQWKNRLKRTKATRNK